MNRHLSGPPHRGPESTTAKLLLNKLEAVGVKRKVLYIFAYYLSKRTQSLPTQARWKL